MTVDSEIVRTAESVVNDFLSDMNGDKYHSENTKKYYSKFKMYA